MSEKEYKARCESLFAKNTVLLNQQKIDAEQIRALQKQNGELTDKIKELEAQIEKMKEKTVSLCEGCVRLPMLYKELDKEIKEK